MFGIFSYLIFNSRYIYTSYLHYGMMCGLDLKHLCLHELSSYSPPFLIVVEINLISCSFPSFSHCFGQISLEFHFCHFALQLVQVISLLFILGNLGGSRHCLEARIGVHLSHQCRQSQTSGMFSDLSFI